MVADVRIEANLLGSSIVTIKFILQMHNQKLFYLGNEGHISQILAFQNVDLKYGLKIQVKVLKYNICNDAIRWRMSNSINVILVIFTLAVTVSDILRFEVFDLEYLG